MSKVIITGGAGFIGSHVARNFVEAGHDVVVYDTFKQYYLPEPSAPHYNPLIRLTDIYNHIEVVQGDTLHKDFLRRILTRVNPDIVVHMAALPIAALAIEHTEDAFNSILKSTINILEILRDLNQQCTLLYTSSSMVYGDFQTALVTEESPTDPKEIYGSLKLAGEIISRGYMKRYGIDVRIARPTAVYGPYDTNQRVLYKFVSRALRGEKLLVHGDGSMSLDFTFVEDTAKGIYLAASHPGGVGQIFNIARGEAKTLSDAIDIINECLNKIEVEYQPVPDHIPERGTLDNSKARERIGFEPKYDLDIGLKHYISHLQDHSI